MTLSNNFKIHAKSFQDLCSLIVSSDFFGKRGAKYLHMIDKLLIFER